MSRSLSASSHMFSVNSVHWLRPSSDPVSLNLRSMAVMTMTASPIQKMTKKPRK